MTPEYLDRLWSLWTDPATHQVAVLFLFLWWRIEKLGRSTRHRLRQLELEVFAKSTTPAFTPAHNRRRS